MTLSASASKTASVRTVEVPPLFAKCGSVIQTEKPNEHFIEIRGVPETVGREELFNKLENEFGSIWGFHCHKKKHYGYASVRFVSEDSANACLLAQDHWRPFGSSAPLSFSLMDKERESNIVGKGKRCYDAHYYFSACNTYQPVCELYVSGYPIGLTDKAVLKNFSVFGHLKASRVLDRNAPRTAIEFHCWDDLQNFLKAISYGGWNPFSDSDFLKAELSEAAISSLKLFIVPISPLATEAELAKTFEVFGKLDERDGVAIESGTRRNFAFVRFASPDGVRAVFKHCRFQSIRIQNEPVYPVLKVIEDPTHYAIATGATQIRVCDIARDITVDELVRVFKQFEELTPADIDLYNGSRFNSAVVRFRFVAPIHRLLRFHVVQPICFAGQPISITQYEQDFRNDASGASDTKPSSLSLGKTRPTSIFAHRTATLPPSNDHANADFPAESPVLECDLPSQALTHQDGLNLPVSGGLIPVSSQISSSVIPSPVIRTEGLQELHDSVSSALNTLKQKQSSGQENVAGVTRLPAAPIFSSTSANQMHQQCGGGETASQTNAVRISNLPEHVRHQDTLTFPIEASLAEYAGPINTDVARVVLNTQMREAVVVFVDHRAVPLFLKQPFVMSGPGGPRETKTSACFEHVSP